MQTGIAAGGARAGITMPVSGTLVGSAGARWSSSAGQSTFLSAPLLSPTRPRAVMIEFVANFAPRVPRVEFMRRFAGPRVGDGTTGFAASRARVRRPRAARSRRLLVSSRFVLQDVDTGATPSGVDGTAHSLAAPTAGAGGTDTVPAHRLADHCCALGISVTDLQDSRSHCRYRRRLGARCSSGAVTLEYLTATSRPTSSTTPQRPHQDRRLSDLRSCFGSLLTLNSLLPDGSAAVDIITFTLLLTPPITISISSRALTSTP